MSQPRQFDPPQSMSLSLPFFTPSAQLGAWHRPAVQSRLAQSPFPPQVLPGAHAVQRDPPQSTSLSPAFCVPSEHVAATQTPLVHTKLSQSPDA
jgi:hypothetical protein